MIRSRFRNAIQKVKTYPGADCDSDHNPLVGTLRVKVKKTCTSKRKIQCDIAKLKEAQMKERYAMTVSNRFQVLTGDLEQETPSQRIEAEWKGIKEVLKESAKEVIPNKVNQAKQPWMNKEILDMMKERKKKKIDPVTYRRINRNIQRLCKEAKQQWMNRQCEEMEELQRRHDVKAMHKKSETDHWTT